MIRLRLSAASDPFTFCDNIKYTHGCTQRQKTTCQAFNIGLKPLRDASVSATLIEFEEFRVGILLGKIPAETRHFSPNNIPQASAKAPLVTRRSE